jgi:ATP-dependent DNA helicase RecG
MLGDKLKSFFLKGTNWDAITGDYTIDVIDEESIRKFIKLAIKSGRLRAVDESEDIKTILTRLKLIPNGKLTNGAIMLFGKDPQKFFINVRCEIKDELVRKNIWDYPLDAIREALLNALIHRDYFKFNVQTQIKIFEGYIWFFNIGGLPEGITIELLKGPHSSVPRNPLIAHIFYLAGFIEEYGSGIRRMTESLSEAGLPYTEFKEEFAGFSLYMRKDKYSNERLREMGLNERQIRAVMYLKEEGKITNKVYRHLTGLSDEGARIDLTELIDRGLLQRKNKGRGAHYVLKYV